MLVAKDLFYCDKQYPESVKSLFLYVRLVFRDEVPRFCTRGLHPSLQLDIGASPNGKPPSQPQSAKKSVLTEEGIKKALEPSPVENALMIAQTQAVQQSIRITSMKILREELEREEKDLANQTLTEQERNDLVQYYKALHAKRRKLVLESSEV